MAETQFMCLKCCCQITSWSEEEAGSSTLSCPHCGSSDLRRHDPEELFSRIFRLFGSGG
jgi:DNA-directed RNA polymerase subunit RPC12/RpoP